MDANLKFICVATIRVLILLTGVPFTGVKYVYNIHLVRAKTVKAGCVTWLSHWCRLGISDGIGPQVENRFTLLIIN